MRYYYGSRVQLHSFPTRKGAEDCVEQFKKLPDRLVRIWYSPLYQRWFAGVYIKEVYPLAGGNPSVSKKAIAEAEQAAKDEIARLIRESRSSEDALKSARLELEAIEAELGKRSIPYGGDFYRKRRGRLPQAFPGVPAAILDAKRIIYREFIDELEQQLAIPKTRKEMLIDYDRGHSLEQLKEMCRTKGLSVSGGKKELIARLI